MSMKEERVRALIVQYDDLIRYRKKLLDCNLAETLLSVIPACVKNQDELEVHLNEKIDECKRIKTRLKAARFKVSKLYAKYKENTEVKEFLDFAVFLSTVGDANEEIIPSSDSDDRDLLPQHNTSLKDYFTDNLINGDSLDLESLNLPTEEEMFDDDDASTLISKLDAEKFQPKYFNSERDKLDYLVKKLCCLLQKYQRQVRLLDERNETNGSNAQTSNLPLKIDEDVQIYNKIHSAVEYDYESSSPSPANSPIDDIPSLEKNDYDVSLLEEKLQGSADLGETAVESKLQTDVTVQGLNVLTNASEASSPIVLPQSPLKTNNVFDIEFIDVNLSVDDCGSTPKKCDTVVHATAGDLETRSSASEKHIGTRKRKSTNETSASKLDDIQKNKKSTGIISNEVESSKSDDPSTPPEEDISAMGEDSTNQEQNSLIGDSFNSPSSPQAAYAANDLEDSTLGNKTPVSNSPVDSLLHLTPPQDDIAFVKQKLVLLENIIRENLEMKTKFQSPLSINNRARKILKLPIQNLKELENFKQKIEQVDQETESTFKQFLASFIFVGEDPIADLLSSIFSREVAEQIKFPDLRMTRLYKLIFELIFQKSKLKPVSRYKKNWSSMERDKQVKVTLQYFFKVRKDYSKQKIKRRRIKMSGRDEKKILSKTL